MIFGAGKGQCPCCGYPVDRLMHVLGCEADDDEDSRPVYGLGVDEFYEFVV